MSSKPTPLCVGTVNLGEAQGLLASMGNCGRLLSHRGSDEGSVLRDVRRFFDDTHGVTLWFLMDTVASTGLPRYTMHADTSEGRDQRVPPGSAGDCMPLTYREYCMDPRRDRTYNEG